jgi:hypothetical protein
MEKPGPEIQLAHCGASATYAQKTAKPQANGSGASYSRFTIHYLLLQLIGSDRSAFAASRHKVAGQSKTKESSECSIHDEGLLEHPIKN